MIQNIISLKKDSVNSYNTDNIRFLTTKSLASEKVFNIEVGYKLIHKNYNLSINGYYIEITSEYVSTGLINPYSGFMNKICLPFTRRIGLESDGWYRIKNLSILYNVQSQYNQLFGVDDYVQYIPFCPNLLGNLGFTYKMNKFNVGLNVQYVGRMAMSLNSTDAIRPFERQMFSSQYVQTGGFISYQYNQVTISFRANNIFNSKYYIPAGHGHYDANGNFQDKPLYYVGQLLNYNISINYKF
jgi:hypothetical protein